MFSAWATAVGRHTADKENVSLPPHVSYFYILKYGYILKHIALLLLEKSSMGLNSKADRK